MMEYNEENLKLVSDAIVKNLTPDLLPVKWIKLYRAQDDNEIWHWWCLDINENLIDLTSDQYYSLGKEPPYDRGEKSSMLGFAYRTRTLELLERVKKELGIKNEN